MNEHKKMSLRFLFCVPCAYLLSALSDAFIRWRAPLFNPEAWSEAARFSLLVVCLFLLALSISAWFHKK